ncbi:MAG: hypothetical protein ACK50E_04570 [Bacteroidota bacterium]|jgi:hypothetical protein
MSQDSRDMIKEVGLWVGRVIMGIICWLLLRVVNVWDRQDENINQLQIQFQELKTDVRIINEHVIRTENDIQEIKEDLRAK